MTVSSVEDPAAFPEAFEDALNAGDMERITALYDDAAVLRTQAGETASGPDAVRSEMGRLISAGASIANTLRHVVRHGDTALIIVDYVLRLSGPAGAPITVRGAATNVLRLQPGRGWRMIIANPQGTA